MATLESFLKAGRLGPLVLGMGPVEVITVLGDPEDTSEKANPLTVRYGPVQLVFWSKPKQRKQDLREILISYKPRFRKLPRALRLSDWNPTSAPNEQDFLDYLKSINLDPVHTVSGENGTQLIFISGVTALLIGQTLHSVRLTQQESIDDELLTLSDRREPSEAQIREMLAEADQALKAGAFRAALMTAWAGLEAALRRAVLRSGGKGRIGIQPTVLLRELLSSNELTVDEHLKLEKLRQLRTAAAHGLAPTPLDAGNIDLLRTITDRLLGPSLRKQREVGYIYPVEANEGFSVLANSRHYKLLADYLRNKGLSVLIEENVIRGDQPQHDVQIQKSIEFSQLNQLIDEWKKDYQLS